MTKTERKSVSLNKHVRSEMLHSFFKDISREPRLVLEKIENECAQDIYDLIYGDMDFRLKAVPECMLRLESSIPLPVVYVQDKKAKRKKGFIETTQKRTFQFRNFRGYVEIDRPLPTKSVDDLDLIEELPQVFKAPRYGSSHLSGLEIAGLVNKTLRKKIEARYIKACKAADKVIAPVEDAMAGVTEILVAVKTSKGLLAAWPGCEKYLSLPEASIGVLVKVDIKALDKNLAALYPPATKTGLTEDL